MIAVNHVSVFDGVRQAFRQAFSVRFINRILPKNLLNVHSGRAIFSEP